MHFFEKPKQVTAIVFFIQTIIALLNMKHFIYLGAYFFVFILFFVGFPFLFYYIYNLILNDLEKDKKEPEMTHFVRKEDAESPTSNKEEEKAFETKKDEPAEQLEKETESESSDDIEPLNVEVPVKVTEAVAPILEAEPEPEPELEPEPEPKPSTRMSRVEARKQIQVINFVDEEPASQEEIVVSVIEPVFIRKEKPHRKKRKQEASKEALNLPRETQTVKPFSKDDEAI